jgi:hypothetical protein
VSGDIKENVVHLVLTAELLTILRRKHLDKDHYFANSIKVHLLEESKDDFVKEFGQEKYDQQLALASRTIVEIKIDKDKRTREKIVKQEQKLAKLKTEEQKLAERRAKEDEMEKRKIIQDAEELERDNRL